MSRPLSAQEAAFCRSYILETDRNGAEAARKAGYAASGAAVQAVKLLKRPQVRAEIARLEAEALKRSGMVSSLLRSANAGADPTEPAALGSIAAEIRAETDAATIAALARAYVLAGLKENFDICLGRRKRTLIKFKKVKNTEGKVVEEAHEIQIFDPNPSAANAAAQILLAAPEISGAKAAVGADESANAAIHEALREFEGK